ncbi:DUF1328 domain-containing protein [archaeon]|nr:DUF1328 domain-containing protein [archaeon]NCP79130.1 DUF1328 domain-containing protein [archaeon]NCP97924.1 DUF1328 domain-containing protein [archaeon]NCQ06897.1 DUF1328 domain-containing protein [archaeon]NCQ50693.1 DUF1328 domain-containing protein [archaeon]
MFLRWAIIFLVIAIISAIFGFGRISDVATNIALVLFYIFVVLFVIFLVWGLFSHKK